MIIFRVIPNDDFVSSDSPARADIALVRVQDPIDFSTNENIRPICLPTKSTPNKAEVC